MEETKEITTRNVLLEYLTRERQKLKMVSKGGNMLEPAFGLAAEWKTQRKRCEILQKLVRALESEPVRRSIAEWQKEMLQAPEQARAEAMRFTEETKAYTGCK